METYADLATRLVPCDYCLAQPGARCVTVTGRRASYAHGPRTAALRAAWRLGYAAAYAEVLERVQVARRRGRTVAQVEAELAPLVRYLLEAVA